MLKALNVHNSTCFEGGELEFGPFTKVNLLFGRNGAGKTTLSRALNSIDPANDTPDVTWGDGEHLAPYVYNEDFVRANFYESTRMAGVFYLAPDAQRHLDSIEELKRQIESASDQIKKKSAVLDDGKGGGKRNELERIDDDLANELWRHKKTFSSGDFQEFLFGEIKRKKTLLDRVRDARKTSLADGDSISSIEAEYYEIIARPDEPVQEIPQIPEGMPGKSEISAWSNLLADKTTGNGRSRLSQLVEELGITGWVREGKDHLARAGGVCPFCQEAAPDDLAAQLSDYFNDSLDELEGALSAFSKEAVGCIGAMRQFLLENRDTLRTLCSSAAVDACLSRLSNVETEVQEAVRAKLANPSGQIRVPGISSALDAATQLVHEAQDVAETRNIKAKSRGHDLGSVSARGLAIFAHVHVNAAVEASSKQERDLNRAIGTLEQKIIDDKSRLRGLRDQLDEEVSSVRSSSITAGRINSQLRSAGIYAFSVEMESSVAPDDLLGEAKEPSGYNLVRPDKTQAEGRSLSEGERTLVSFLYFLQSVEADGEPNDNRRLVVIDDPISSLDSDSLFLVASHVRRLVRDVLSKKYEGGIGQLLVTTHNRRFRSEIANEFYHKTPPEEFSYFRLLKTNSGMSELRADAQQDCLEGVYESMWRSVLGVRESGEDPQGLMPNALRRILEIFESRVSDFQRYEILHQLPPTDYELAAALLMWTNAGSHDMEDDLDYSTSEAEVERWFSVFEKIFKAGGYRKHFDRMISI